MRAPAHNPLKSRPLAFLAAFLLLPCLFASATDTGRMTAKRTHPATLSVVHLAQSNPQRLVTQVMNNELYADQHDHSLWTYISENKQDGKDRTDKVIETTKGDLKLLIAENGHPLSPDELKTQEADLEKTASSPSALAKERANYNSDDKKARELMKMLPTAFLYKYEGEQDGIIHLSFRPDPKFNPPTREAKVFHSMVGVMWVQGKEKRLVKLAGRLVEDVDFGLGILGKLKKGGTFETDRAEMSPGHWKTTLTDVHISGHILFFKSISEQQHEVDRDYKPVPPMNPVQAAKRLETESRLAEAR